MKLFRSEDALDAWLAARGHQRGGVIGLETLRTLAARWYGDRLDPGWRPRSAEGSQAILAASGLTDPFWRLQP
jgi:hypothetical protein